MACKQKFWQSCILGNMPKRTSHSSVGCLLEAKEFIYLQTAWNHWNKNNQTHKGTSEVGDEI